MRTADLFDERYDACLRKFQPEAVRLSNIGEGDAVSFLVPNDEDIDGSNFSQSESSEEEPSFFESQSCKRLLRRSSSYPRSYYCYESPSPARNRSLPTTDSSSVEQLKSLITTAITALERTRSSRAVSVQRGNGVYVHVHVHVYVRM